MRRRTFDTILTAVGVVLTVVLLVAGGLLHLRRVPPGRELLPGRAGDSSPAAA
jgi:hypothetical protein